MSKQKNSKITPLMQQYFEIKSIYPDALLLFQVGDFYELFFEDAKKVSAFLGIVLTKRGTHKGDPIPLCGVPLHAIDHYITKLVKGGFKLAICDQLEEAQAGKVVRRGVTKVLTPGTLTDSNLLDEKSASYLFSFFPTQDRWGLLFGELLTAQLFATVLPKKSEKLLESELVRFFPDEILLPHDKLGKSFQSIFKKMGYFTTLQDLDISNHEHTKEIDTWMAKQFNQKTRDILSRQNSLLYSLYNFYNYLSKNQFGALEHFRALHFYQPDDFLLLDPATQRNLELLKNNQDGSRKYSLFSLMDKAATCMGSRMVKKWICRPLIKKETIEQRLDVVQKLVDDISLSQKIREFLVQIGDIERIIGRIALSRATFSDYIHLTRALEIIPEVKQLLNNYKDIILLRVIISYMGEFTKIYQLLLHALNNDPSKDWVIKTGFNQKLDELRELVFNSSTKILELEQQEKEKTGINSLKIAYNKIHGYYVEVTKANLHLVPDYYIRQQTLVNRERFIFAELKELQQEIVDANTQIEQVEKDLFQGIKNDVYQYTSELRKLAHALAHLDALLSLSHIAYDYDYTRPEFNKKSEIYVTQGRHPVVEIAEDSNFIPNDTVLHDKHSLLIITGPNMGGKSTYLRQVALISIMAQCGSFVPAKSANLALLDRVFTRIGSGDNLAGGKSTFLVEMEETALICKQATNKSLVILDEVGRGTSTFDGFAIAQAVVEHIYTQIGAKCLFATHYHELTALKDKFPGIDSYYASSKKTAGGILFLYKIVQGVADGSFGIEVAKLADLPKSLIERAAIVLQGLEKENSSHRGVSGAITPENIQYSAAIVTGETGETGEDVNKQKYEQIMQENNGLQGKVQNLTEKLKISDHKLEILKKIDYNELSPKQAFDLLWEIRESLPE